MVQKKDAIPRLFDGIAHRYDLLNRLLSFGRDAAWRRRLVLRLSERPPGTLLDLATGTGDVLLAACAAGSPLANNLKLGIGADISANMLAMARRKTEAAGLTERLRFVRADGLRLPFPDALFDAVTVAFGIRNMPSVNAALSEMHRVLAPGGRLLVLEFSMPGSALLRWGYLLYFRYLLPVIGGVVSGRYKAYRYLNRSVEAFPYGRAFVGLLKAAGFEEVTGEPMTLGVATLYSGRV